MKKTNLDSTDTLILVNRTTLIQLTEPLSDFTSLLPLITVKGFQNDEFAVCHNNKNYNRFILTER